MNKIIELEELCSEYYKFVYNGMVEVEELPEDIEELPEDIEELPEDIEELPEDIEHWLEDTFKFTAVNDKLEFYNWYEETEGDPTELLDCASTCYIIKHLQTWYEDNYGKECIMDYDKFTPRYILNNFAYVTLYAMSMEDLKELLIEEEEEEN